MNIFFGFAQNKISNSPKNDSLIKQYGLAISKSIAHNEIKSFLKELNSDAFYPEIVLYDQNNKPLLKFNKKFKKSFQDRVTSFPQEISDAVQNGGIYNFVSYHFDNFDHTYHLIFRYYTPQYGLDYHDYRILKNKNTFFIDDIFVFSTNQKLSETLKLLYLSAVPKKDMVSLLKKPNYKPILMLKNFVDAANNNDYKKAYKHITLLNNQLHNKDRFIAFLKLQISSSVNEEAYVDTIESIIANFRMDPNVQLIVMPYFYANKEYDEVEKCINNLRNYTHDSFLDFEKGNLFFAKEDYESAAIFYQNMLKKYPNFHLPKFSLLVTYERTKQFNKMNTLLDLILSTTTYNKTKLIEKITQKLPLYSKSKAFKIWQKK